MARLLRLNYPKHGLDRIQGEIPEYLKPLAKIIRNLNTCLNWPPPGHSYHLRKRFTPAWADHDKIKAIYAECRRVTAATGIKHHVDHYYPIRGYKVCGLHVHENLQIIPAIENLKKSNDYEVE